MASYSIPEEVTGLYLFVPDDYDYFSIDATGMPNGDPCLIVHGNVSTNYRAFQKAQTLSPDVFLSTASTWAMTFWFKCAVTTSPGASGSVGLQANIMSVQTAAGPTSYSNNTNYVWSIGRKVAATDGKLSFLSNDQGANSQTSTNVCDNAWHLITINVNPTSTGTATIYVDASASGGSAAKRGTPATAGMFFSIGSYGQNAAAVSYNQEWRVGKIAFYSAPLTLGQRTSLYNAMVSGGGAGPGPTVTCTINVKSGQADPATGEPVLFEAVFSEVVTGFSGSDVILSGTAGATVAALSTLDNVTYTVGVSGMTTSGTVVASIPAACATSLSGGPNAASTSTDNSIAWS